MSRPFTPPDQFEEYRIVRALGRGAMGQVYLAHDTLLDRPVAVKFIANLQPDHPDAPSLRERFFIEARAIARLAHPNVVAVHRVGEWHGRPYLVSELVRGKSLDRVAKPMAPASVLQIARGLCRGLSAAHRKGVLHRDIKPANCMLTPTGDVKLLDFGLAKLLDSEPAQSGTFAAMSAMNLSPIVASPPQAGGLPLALSPVEKPVAPAPPPASAPLVETRPAQLMKTPSQPVPALGPSFRNRSDPGLSAEEQLAITAPFLVRKDKEAEKEKAARPESSLEQAPTLGAAEAAAELEDVAPAQQSGSASLTQAGAVIGSPLYMAPELWRGEPATRRSDIYALGTLLYELCAERAPHDGSTLQELPRRVQTVDVQPLIRVAPHVEPKLAAIIDRCLARAPDERFESADALLEALEQLPLGAEPPRLTDTDEPYRGLRSFEAEQRGFFFGRDADIRTLLERLRTEALIAVTGDSGVGKSSLCKAGVLSAVQRGELGPEVRIVSLVPGRYPLAGLSAALSPVIDREERELLPELLNMPEEVGRQLRRRNRTNQQPLRVLLFIDQCEELFTSSEPREVEQLAGALSRLCNYSPDFRVLLSVRSDFLSRLAALPELGGSIGRSLYLVGPLTTEGLRAAIVQPALTFGVRFESTALVDELIRSTGDAASGLPLLSFTLAALWQERDRKQGLITQAALLSLGGVTGALARHADGVLSRMPPGERQMARRLLGQLVSSEGIRVRKQRSELLGETGTASALSAAAALEALVRGRILVAYTPAEAPDDSAYELAHQAFLSGWATLRGWLARDAELRALRQRLGQAATDWQRFGHPPTLLWQRPQLAEAEPLDGSALTELERDFLRAGARAARRQQLLRWTAVVALPLTLGMAYGAAKLRARAELRRKVHSHLVQADNELAFGRSKNRRAEELREEALTAFDSRNSVSGEALWREVQTVETEARAAYRRASKSAEAAFMLAGSDRDARDTLATTLSERALISERNHYVGNRDELLARLWLFDQDGSYRRKWFAPAIVRVHTQPANAEGTLVPIDSSDENRRLRYEAARSLTPGLREPLELEPGAYLLLLRAAGRAEVRYPLLLRRGMNIDLNIELLPPAAIPAGFVYVPGGLSQIGSDAEDSLRRDFFYHVPIHPIAVGSFLMAQTETTYADWLTFLRALPPSEAARRLPFASGLSGSLSLREDPGSTTDLATASLDAKHAKPLVPYKLTLQPTTVAYTAREGEPLRYSGRTKRAAVDWRRLPVSGISADDALAYVRWLDGSGRLPGARLCTELEWERAARGADERLYPHGDQLEPDDANFDRTYGQTPQAMGPDEVGAHPASRSLFLIDDLVGNVLEWTVSALSGRRYVLRGGAYYYGAKTGRIDNRHEPEETLRNPTVGLRVCATIRGSTSL